ncbi:MAG: hypothetical protein ACPGUZ_01275 [Holosporaceae bacterium]
MRAYLLCIFCLVHCFYLTASPFVGKYYQWNFNKLSSHLSEAAHPDKSLHITYEDDQVASLPLSCLTFIGKRTAVTDLSKIFLSKDKKIRELGQLKPVLRTSHGNYFANKAFCSFSCSPKFTTENETEAEWEKVIRHAHNYTQDTKPLFYLCFTKDVPDALRQQGAPKASLQHNIKTSLADIEKHFRHKIVQDTQALQKGHADYKTPRDAVPAHRKRPAAEHTTDPVKKTKQENGVQEALKSHTTNGNPKNKKASAVKPQNNVKPATPKKVFLAKRAHDPSYRKLSRKKLRDAQGAVIEDQDILSFYVPKHLAQITKDPEQKKQYLDQRKQYEALIAANNI